MDAIFNNLQDYELFKYQLDRNRESIPRELRGILADLIVKINRSTSMAKILEIDEKEWQEWLSTRPQIVQDVAAKIRPDTLYRLSESGRVFPLSYAEDGTVTVAVTGDYNALSFERQVFGISPDDLTECELPADDEPVGAALHDKEDIDDFLQTLHIHP